MRRGWENKRPPCPWSLTPLFLEPYLLLLDLDTLPIVLNTLHVPMELPPPPVPGALLPAVGTYLELSHCPLSSTPCCWNLLYTLPLELYPLLLELTLHPAPGAVPLSLELNPLLLKLYIRSLELNPLSLELYPFCWNCTPCPWSLTGALTPFAGTEQ